MHSDDFHARALRHRWRAARPSNPEDTLRAAVPVVAPIGPSHRVPAERSHQLVDLLNPEPATIVDEDALKWALSFGFAGGDVGGMLSQAMNAAPVAASDWDPDSFAAGLLVKDLVETSLRLRIGTFGSTIDTAFLTRVLTQPPKDLETIHYRQQVLRELAETPSLRSQFQELYRALHRVRDLFDSNQRVSDPEVRARRLELLAEIRAVFLVTASGFERCTSGLSRIHRFGAHVVGTDAFRMLTELLDFENHRASVQLKVRMGADGRIRHFEVQHVAENRKNWFHQSSAGRYLGRLRLFFRGHSMSESDVVTRWMDAVFDNVHPLLLPLFQLLGEMEVYLCSLSLKDAATEKGLEVCLPRFADGESTLHHLFNPFLLMHERPLVPGDVRLGDGSATTLITGPNSGGKTRLLQAIGIAQMLGQAGLFVPAAAATLRPVKGLFVSLIEEVRADHREGRLGTELIRIRQLFERTRRGSLIVLDELCSGTNPSEGEEIIRLVLSLLGELKADVFITTHFLQFAQRLAAEPEGAQLRFLQVELDEDERPTYRFVPGVAQTSLAHQTARRLGVTREALLDVIRNGQRAAAIENAST